MELTEQERKERRLITQRKYRASEKGKTSMKKYNDSDKGKTRHSKYRKTEKGKETKKKNLDNFRKTDKYKEYTHTDLFIKSRTISSWISQGLFIDNYDEIYERYSMAIFCDICECVLDQDNKSKKCMDHDHDTGIFRNILCKACNTKLGNIERGY